MKFPPAAGWAPPMACIMPGCMACIMPGCIMPGCIMPAPGAMLGVEGPAGAPGVAGAADVDGGAEETGAAGVAGAAAPADAVAGGPFIIPCCIMPCCIIPPVGVGAALELGSSAMDCGWTGDTFGTGAAPSSLFQCCVLHVTTIELDRPANAGGTHVTRPSSASPL